MFPVPVDVSSQELAHELAAALYRLLSKRESALREGALSVAEAVLSHPPVGQNRVESGREQTSVVPGRGLAGISPGVVERRTTFYAEVFARHGVLKLVSKFCNENNSSVWV